MADIQPAEEAKAKKPPTTFASLPAELRNYIYDLSGCLKILQCRQCHSTIHGDEEDVNRLSCCYYSHDGPAIDCEYRKKAYLWVNRKSRRGDGDCGRHLGWDDGGMYRRSEEHGTHSMVEYLEDHVASIAQPAISKASKQLRSEMLSIFYGDHVWKFTAFNYAHIFQAPVAWLRKIGRTNAALVKGIMVVLPWHRDATARVELTQHLNRVLEQDEYQAEVVVQAYEYGFCRCETCMAPGVRPAMARHLQKPPFGAYFECESSEEYDSSEEDSD